MVTVLSLALGAVLTKSPTDTTYQVVPLTQIDYSKTRRQGIGSVTEGFLMSANGQVAGRYYHGSSWYSMVWNREHGVVRFGMPRGENARLLQTPTGSIYGCVTGYQKTQPLRTSMLYRLGEDAGWSHVAIEKDLGEFEAVNSSGCLALSVVETLFRSAVLGPTPVISEQRGALVVTGPSGQRVYPPAGVYLCDNGDLIEEHNTRYWPKEPWRIASGKLETLPDIEGTVPDPDGCFIACSGSEFIVGSVLMAKSPKNAGSFLWMTGKVTFFPPPEGGGKTLALGVNKDATIVGQIWKSSKDLYGYVQKLEGEQVDANTLLSPEDAKVWKVEALEGISDEGVLLGAARNLSNGNKLYEIVLSPKG